MRKGILNFWCGKKTWVIFSGPKKILWSIFFLFQSLWIFCGKIIWLFISPTNSPVFRKITSWVSPTKVLRKKKQKWSLDWYFFFSPNFELKKFLRSYYGSKSSSILSFSLFDLNYSTKILYNKITCKSNFIYFY